MKKLSAIFLTVLLCACSSTPENYEIVNKDYFAPLRKLELNVRIQKELNKTQLETISNDIKDKVDSLDNIMIFFYTPDIEIGTGAYAVAKFDHSLDIDIQRASAEEKTKMNNATLDEKAKIIGKWNDPTLYMERKITIYTINDTLKIRYVYKDGSFGDKLLKTVKEKGLTRYNIVDNSGEWYVLEKNGNLSTWGEGGKYDEMKSIK